MFTSSQTDPIPTVKGALPPTTTPIHNMASFPPHPSESHSTHISLQTQYNTLSQRLKTEQDQSKLAPLLVHRGQVLSQMGLHQHLLRDTNAALAIEPLTIQAYLLAGSTLERFKGWDQALLLYDAGINAFSTSLNAALAQTTDENNQEGSIIHDGSDGDGGGRLCDQEVRCEDDGAADGLNNDDCNHIDHPIPTLNSLNHSDSTQDLKQLSTTPAPSFTPLPTHLAIRYRDQLIARRTNLIQFLDENFIATQLHQPIIPPKLQIPVQKFNTLTNWLIQNGSQFQSLTIKHFTNTHRGVFSICQLHENETICFIPHKLIITSQTARNSMIGQLFNVFSIDSRSRHSVIALYLLHEMLSSRLFESGLQNAETDLSDAQPQQQRQQQQQQHSLQPSSPPQSDDVHSPTSSTSNSSHVLLSIPTAFTSFPSLLSVPSISHQPSFFQPYLDILPESFDTIPLFFNCEELTLLLGSFTLDKIGDRCKSLFEEYNHIIDQLTLKTTQFFADQIDWGELNRRNRAPRQNRCQPAQDGQTGYRPALSAQSTDDETNTNPLATSTAPSETLTTPTSTESDSTFSTPTETLSLLEQPQFDPTNINTPRKEFNSLSGPVVEFHPLAARSLPGSNPLLLVQQNGSSNQSSLDLHEPTDNGRTLPYYDYFGQKSIIHSSSADSPPPLPFTAKFLLQASHPWLVQLYELLGLVPICMKPEEGTASTPTTLTKIIKNATQHLSGNSDPSTHILRQKLPQNTPINDLNLLCLFIREYIAQVIIPFSFDQFVWARMCVITRIFGMTIGNLKTDGLVPYCDMLNHKVPRETKWNYDNAKNGFAITSLVNRAHCGVEIFDSYGRKCNNRFFINYGFALEHNDDNEAAVKVGCDLYHVDQAVEIDFCSIDFDKPLLSQALPGYTIKPVQSDEYYYHNMNHNNNNLNPNADWDGLNDSQNSTPASVHHSTFSQVLSRTRDIDTFPSIYAAIKRHNHSLSGQTRLGSESCPNQVSPTQQFDPIDSSPPAPPPHEQVIQVSVQQPQSSQLKLCWPHESISGLNWDPFLSQKLVILGIPMSSLSPKTSPFTTPLQREQQHQLTEPLMLTTQVESRHPRPLSPTHNSIDPLTVHRKFLLSQTERTYQIPANPMDSKTVQLLSYLRFIHLSPQQIIELRRYQVQANIITKTVSPSSTSIISSMVPIPSPPPSQEQKRELLHRESSNQCDSNSNRSKEHFLNLDDIALISLENEISTLKLLIYVAHTASLRFNTTLEQDILLLRIHHETKLLLDGQDLENPSESNQELLDHSISCQDLFDYFRSPLASTSPSLKSQARNEKPSSFILTSNQYNSLIQCRGEKIVLQILIEFALETLVFIRKQDQLVDNDLLERQRLKNKHAQTTAASCDVEINEQSLPPQPRPTVRELLARHDFLPPGSNTPPPSAQSVSQQSSEIRFAQSFDYKHAGDNHDRKDGDGDNESLSDEDDSAFLIRRRAEILGQVAQQYVLFSTTVAGRVSKWSSMGIEPR